VAPIAAPVLAGTRYQGRPICFSDVIVRRDSPCHAFADLRGRSWAFNEPHSQSGHGITRHYLLEQGETNVYFGQVVEAGSHEAAIRLVASGEVDASAIDSHVLAVACRDHPELAGRLRIIHALGPSPIQPVVAARRVPDSLKAELRALLLGLAADPAGRAVLGDGLIDRYVPAEDCTYEPIRDMLHAAERTGFLEIR
jgi:phosphonate transport system substrate-binding protein